MTKTEQKQHQELFDFSEIQEKARRERELLDQYYSRRRAELDSVIGGMSRLVRPEAKRITSFENWTIPAAAKQLILEAGRPLTTREILDGMLAREWKTKSDRPITVIHSGLAESPYIERVGKKWDISERGLKTEI